MILTLKDNRAENRFFNGPTLRRRSTGRFTPETWKDRWADALADVWNPKPSFAVAIDHKAGSIELAPAHSIDPVEVDIAPGYLRRIGAMLSSAPAIVDINIDDEPSL